MDLAILTVAHSGYARHLPSWAGAVAAMSPTPASAVVVLGPRHGLTHRSRAACEASLGNRLIWVPVTEKRSNGGYRNAGMEAIEAEWTMVVDADDHVLPDAIQHLAPRADGADVLVPGYIRASPQRTVTRAPRLPDVTALPEWRNRGFFLTASAPFRTGFLRPPIFCNTRHPNVPHAVRLAYEGARFAAVPEPCFIYNRRPGSLSWGRRAAQRERVYREIQRHVDAVRQAQAAA
jgi:hypothetical protein